MELDWQNNLNEIKARGLHLMQTEKWSDCRFLVGTSPNSRIIAGHKLILAMASPVFERMFYGNLPPDKDPIEIPDVQPDAFMAMLEYIYSDRINISSFDKACELCYVAKKYMLPYVVENCTRYLWSDLGPKNACRAYEFAKLFDEPTLMQSSMEIISANTREVLEDPNFTDIEPSTLMAILDQDKLNIDSELDLFNALLKYANERVFFNDDAASTSQSNINEHRAKRQQRYQQGEKHGIRCDSNSSNDIIAMRPVEIKMEPDVAAMMHGHDDDDDADDDDNDIDPMAYGNTLSPGHCSDEVLVIDSDASATDTEDNINRSIAKSNQNTGDVATVAAINLNNLMEAQRVVIDEAMIRQAVKKIRFLTLTPQQFAEGPARSKLLQQDEALAILIKISSTSHNECPMPAGFCSSRSSRNYNERVQRDLSLYRHSVPSNGSSTSAENCFIFGMPAQLHASHVTHASAAAMQHHPVANLNGSESDLTNTNDTRRSYCVRTVDQQFDYRNTSVTDCGLTFQVDTNIWITGVQVPTQVLCGELMNSAGFSERYTELLYAHIQDMQGSRLTYTHCTSRVRYDSLLEISFDRPIFIYRNQIYKVYVVFNKIGWYPMYTCVPDVLCNRVKFMFNVGNPTESVRDGLIRAIVFSTPQDHSRPMIE